MPPLHPPTCLSCAGVAAASTYSTIEAQFGVGSVEAPDYNTISAGTFCHTGAQHIKCSDTSTWPTKIFRFDLHLAEDCEPVANVFGKQRNEIKAFKGSPDHLKGFYGQTMRYSWKFRIHSTMLVSRKFTHLFQMKFVGGDQQMPALTFTGAKYSNGNAVFQVRNASASGIGVGYLAVVPLSDVQSKWVEAVVEATMLPIDHGGWLKVQLTRVDNGNTLVNIDTPIDMWRPGNEFMRPKWGIYRQSNHSLILPGDLNDAVVYFADFCIARLDWGAFALHEPYWAPGEGPPPPSPSPPPP